MNFIWFILALVIFGFLFWKFIFVVLTLPSIPAMWLLAFATENARQKWAKWFLLPVSFVIAFLFGTLLPVFVYGGALALIGGCFAEKASHPMIYWIICGVLAFYIMAPSGETNLLGMFLSLGSFLLVIFFKVFTGPLAMLLQIAFTIAFTILYLVIAISIFILICRGLWFVCNWLSKKFPRFVELLRWILVLPGAIASYFAIQVLVAICSYLVGLILPVFGNDMACQLINTILGTIFFVLVGAKIAPKHSFVVAICLTVAYATINITVISMDILAPVKTDVPLWWFTVTGLVSIGTAVACCLFLRNQPKPQICVEKGSDDYLEMESKKSLDIYKHAIKINPDDAEAHSMLGLTYRNLGRYKDSIESFKKAIRIKPDDADAHYYLGLEYHGLGRYQEAIEAYKQAIAIKPDDALAHYHLGEVHLLLGGNSSALEEYKILKTLDENLASELFNLIHK